MTPEPSSPPEQRTSAVHDQHVLMDTFLKTLPTKGPQAVSSRSTGKGQDLSLAHSSALHESLCSVQLARLYEAQKKSQKAIAMYERLKAQDPTREAYFASIIRNLKN